MGYNGRKYFQDNMDIAEEYPENRYRVAYRKRIRSKKEQDLAEHTCCVYARNITEAHQKAGILLDAKGKKAKYTILSVKIIERNRRNKERRTKYIKSTETGIEKNEEAITQGEQEQ